MLINISNKPKKIKMKKICFFAVLATAIMTMTSCRSSKDHASVSAPIQEDVTKAAIGDRIDIPCVEYSMDDADYFRELGVGANINQQSARDAAVESAKGMLIKRLGGFVQNVSKRYSHTAVNDATAERIERDMVNEMNELMEQMVDNADKTCEDIYWRGDGVYTAYYAIQIPKKLMIKAMEDAFAGRNIGSQPFDQASFHEYSIEEIDRLRQARSENGY